MSKSILHVVPHDQAWAVKREGNERASSSHTTQKDAIEAARELAREQDDIVIHRPDGTIRERVTYSSAQAESDAARTTKADLEDTLAVGDRVSWSAVLAGAVIAIATYVALSLLALAIGLSITNRVGERSFVIGAAVTSGLIMLASMFVGGFVASRATAGEQPREAAAYGVLVWGTVFLLLVVGGLGWGVGHLAGVRNLTPSIDATVSADRMKQNLGLSNEQAQRYEVMVRESQQLPVAADATTAAWLTFASVALSLLAAIGGGLFGSGPELVLRQGKERNGVVMVPSPA